MDFDEKGYYKLKKFINHVINNIEDYEFKLGSRVADNGVKYEFTYNDIIVYKPDNIELGVYLFGYNYKSIRKAYAYIIKIKLWSIENNKISEQHLQYEKQSNYFNNVLK